MDSQNTRFVIEKNAADHSAKFPATCRHPVTASAVPQPPVIPPRTFSDPEFAKYDLVNAERFSTVAKSYPNLSGFLSDIDWPSVFRYAESVVVSMLKEVAAEAGASSSALAIAECHPLAMAASDLILRHLGHSDVALSFRRPYFVNSANKGFEAGLLLAASGSDFAESLVRTHAENVRASAVALGEPSKRYFLFVEEGRLDDTVAADLEPYFKTQIGFKETIPTYRVDRFPAVAFLSSKDVRKVFFFDTGRDAGRDFEEYAEDFKAAGIVKMPTSRLAAFPKDVSAYDAYLRTKGAEYRRYRQGLEDTARTTAEQSGILSKDSGYSKKSAPSNASASGIPVQLAVRPYYFGIPLIIVPFLLADTGAWRGVTSSSTSSGGWHGWSSGGSSWSSGGSSYSSSSKSSSSSIRSFGGGGFSKGGG